MCDKIPQIITSNLTPIIVDNFFRLLAEITDSKVKDNKMFQFGVTLTDKDGRSKDIDKRTKDTIDINTAYSQLSILQKKIVNRTFELVIMTPNTDSILMKYRYEMGVLISKESKHIGM